MVEKIFEILNNEDLSFDDVISNLKDCLKICKDNGDIINFTVDADLIYDNLGMDVYAIAIAWIDKSNELRQILSSYESY